MTSTPPQIADYGWRVYLAVLAASILGAGGLAYGSHALNALFQTNTGGMPGDYVCGFNCHGLPHGPETTFVGVSVMIVASFAAVAVLQRWQSSV